MSADKESFEMTDTAPIEFTLSRAKVDYLPATIAMMRFTRRRVPLLLAAFAVLSALYVMITFQHSPDVGLYGIGTFFLMAIYCALLWFGVCFFVARRGANAPGALAPTRYVFSEDGIFGVAENIESKTAWDYWKSVFETSRFLIIVGHTGQWMFFPKNALEAETLRRLKGLVYAKLKPPQS